jgi:putative transposase
MSCNRRVSASPPGPIAPGAAGPQPPGPSLTPPSWRLFHQLRARDTKGRQRPEILYGRRKMTAWLARNGFPGMSKHTVDRVMRAEGMNGLVRGRRTTTTIPSKNGKRAGDLLNREFTAPRPNHTWVADFT